MADRDAVSRIRPPTFASASHRQRAARTASHRTSGRTRSPVGTAGAGSSWPNEGVAGTTALPLRAVADDGAPAPDHTDLRTLLTELKVTRRRRDDADLGSSEWRDADDDLRDLQHAIFLVGMDDPIQTRSREHDSE